MGRQLVLSCSCRSASPDISGAFTREVWDDGLGVLEQLGRAQGLSALHFHAGGNALGAEDFAVDLPAFRAWFDGTMAALAAADARGELPTIYGLWLNRPAGWQESTAAYFTHGGQAYMAESLVDKLVATTIPTAEATTRAAAAGYALPATEARWPAASPFVGSYDLAGEAMPVLDPAALQTLIAGTPITLQVEAYLAAFGPTLAAIGRLLDHAVAAGEPVFMGYI